MAVPDDAEKLNSTPSTYSLAVANVQELKSPQSLTEAPVTTPHPATGPEPTKEASESQPAEPEWSVFSPMYKRYIVGIAAFAGFFSPISSFIFFPATTSMARGLDVSVGDINLAITTYMIVSGIGPSLIGDAADKLGRRPIYLFALILYMVANLGLALQRSLPALLVLRMLQSLGGAGTIALSFGVLSDISLPMDRGAFVSVIQFGPNCAPPFGPIIGGVLSSELGWPWIFWFLLITGGACLILVVVTMPETCRVIAGNGSQPVSGIYRTVLSYIRHPRHRAVPDVVPKSGLATPPPPPLEKPKFTFPNPLACIELLARKDVLVISILYGLCYLLTNAVQASFSALVIDIYDFSELKAGLVYLPYGIACIAANVLWGMFMDFDYRLTAKQRGFAVDTNLRFNTDFPIEFTRLRRSFYVAALTAASIIGYGWALQAKAHLAVVLVLQFIVGSGLTCMYISLGALMTDLNPKTSSTASASASIVRCSMAAAATAGVQPLIDAVGPGWCFTAFGVSCFLTFPLMLLIIRKGHSWKTDPVARLWVRPKGLLEREKKRFAEVQK